MIRGFITFAIEKPLLNHILLLFIILLSIFAYSNVPKEIFPPIQKDKISIIGGYAGASADVLDKLAVQSIEDDLKNISEIDTIESSIKNGSFSMMADIKTGSDNIKVLNDVKDIISNVKRDLPADMNEPVAKIHEETIPLVLIAIAADRPTKELLLLAEELKSKLSTLKDLSDITIRGDADDELVIRLDDEKIEAFGLDRNSVIRALQGMSSIFPIGTIKQQGKHLYISTFNGKKKQQNIENTILGVGAKRVRLGDIASVSFELSDETELSHYNGKRNVSINITKSKSGNSIELVKQIRSILASMQEKHSGVTYAIYTDTSVWIRNRLNTVFANIVFGLGMVFAAMLLFVNRGIAMVVAMGIPLSFMIGLIFTNALGYSLNMLSLLGALIALGMLVDEAIVVAENIYRHMEEGMPRKEAAITGTVEMFPAVLTATLTTVFAFLPLLILSGEMGSFIKILPVMISILLLSSLFEAFYFLPLHSYDFLRLRQEGHFTHGIWEHLYRWYDGVLHLLFQRKWLSLIAIVVSILVLTMGLMKITKFQLFPDFDVTQVYITGKVNINNDLEDTEKVVSKLEQDVLKHIDPKEVSSVTSVIGMRLDAKNHAEIGENLFHIFIDLHERAPDNFFNKYINPYLSLDYNASILSRARPAEAIEKDVKGWIAKTKASEKEFEEVVVSKPQTGVVAHDIEIALGGKEDKKLLEGIDKLQKALASIDGVSNIANDAEIGEKELKIKVNAYGEELGLDEQQLSNELRALYLKGEYGKIFNSSGLVRMRIESTQKDSIESIKDVEVHIPNSDQKIALREVADFIFQQAFVTISKDDAERIRTVTASLNKKKNTSSDVMKKLEPTLDELKTNGFKLTIKGEEQENAKTQKEMSQAGLAAIFLIFITLVWLFDSLKNSLIVLSTIPLVFLGVLVGHMIMGINLTMPSMIGVIGLAGVVVNDGLIMVSFIRDAKDVETLMRKAKTRLRPILMTSITTVLGLLTLIFFASGQAMILQPMAISLGFGITWATVLNLLYVPLFYAVAHRIKKV